MTMRTMTSFDSVALEVLRTVAFVRSVGVATLCVCMTLLVLFRNGFALVNVLTFDSTGRIFACRHWHLFEAGIAPALVAAHSVFAALIGRTFVRAQNTFPFV